MQPKQSEHRVPAVFMVTVHGSGKAEQSPPVALRAVVSDPVTLPSAAKARVSFTLSPRMHDPTRKVPVDESQRVSGACVGDRAAVKGLCDCGCCGRSSNSVTCIDVLMAGIPIPQVSTASRLML